MSNTKLFLNLFRNAETTSYSAGQTIFSADDKGAACTCSSSSKAKWKS